MLHGLQNLKDKLFCAFYRSTVEKAEKPDHSKVHHVFLSRVTGMCSERLNRDSSWDACDA